MRPLKYDCQTCGACCFGLDVFLNDAEAAHFERTPQLLALTTLDDCAPGLVVRLMKKHMDTERCVALAGSDNHWACMIYAQRPALCRELVPGAPDCVAMRKRVGRET